MGCTHRFAASCCRRIRPTCGPLPWVTTTSQPAAAMSAIPSAAERDDPYRFSNVSSWPRRSSAFPPSAMTTRSIGLLEDRLQYIEQARRVGQHLEVVPNADGGLADLDHAPEID